MDDVLGYDIIKVKEVIFMLVGPGSKGQGLLEYGFIIIIVAILLITAVYFLGLGIQGLYITIINSI